MASVELEGTFEVSPQRIVKAEQSLAFLDYTLTHHPRLQAIVDHANLSRRTKFLKIENPNSFLNKTYHQV